jgi:hypothetical protein
MLLFNNDFLGYEPVEHNVLFSGNDSWELYQKNLKIQPIDWYYRTNQISYIRNKNGHRCKNIKDIDLDNYILFTGCSHTEGIGLELEKTYPYLVSKELNCDYYNLAIGGSGIDTLSYNLITWFSTIKKKPKFLVLQWTHHNRFITVKDKNKNTYETCGPWSTDDDNKNMLIYGAANGFFETKRNMMRTLLKNLIDFPVIEIANLNAKFNDDTIILDPIKKDFARDEVHFGILSNLKYASIIKTRIKDKYNHELNYN